MSAVLPAVRVAVLFWRTWTMADDPSAAVTSACPKSASTRPVRTTQTRPTKSLRDGDRWSPNTVGSGRTASLVTANATTRATTSNPVVVTAFGRPTARNPAPPARLVNQPTAISSDSVAVAGTPPRPTWSRKPSPPRSSSGVAAPNRTSNQYTTTIARRKLNRTVGYASVAVTNPPIDVQPSLKIDLRITVTGPRHPGCADSRAGKGFRPTPSKSVAKWS